MVCDSNMLLYLPDDVFAIISRSFSPRDICNLSLCCKSLNSLVASEKIWLTQCEVLGMVPHKDLVEWRKGVACYKALCRFLLKVQPLIGIWVHQNPELGNVVYVMPGFVSVVGCRIIPQELGPLGMEDGPILWASVFEVVADFDGSTMFFLHGREKSVDYVYPGLAKSIDKYCNVLLLEVEPEKNKNVGSLLESKSFAHSSGLELSRRVGRSNSDICRSQLVMGNSEGNVSFSRLAFSDRRKLLEVTTSQVRHRVTDAVLGPLFPRLRDDEENFQKDLVLLRERILVLRQIHRLGCSETEMEDYKANSQGVVGATQLDFDDKCSRAVPDSLFEEDGGVQCVKRKGIRGYFWNSLKHILGRSNSVNDSHSASKKLTTNGEIRHARLQEFLRSSDTIRLTLNASNMKLSSYRAWPNMHDSRYALYKLPLRVPGADQEYAGLWGGAFGWPPGKPSEDKPGKALFFLLLSYEEFQGQQLLIATKILEGTHYVLHPNGSAMFIANINEPSSEPFPWNTDADSLPVNIKHAFTGEGIASGYGFRYPGSKPGSLFVFHNGVIAFIWKETRAVLTLQRLNLQELLKKGERIPSLLPIANFSYLTKSYSNVFAGIPTSSNSLSSPRKGRH